MPHPVLQPGAVAVITGGASGIGLATAKRFAELGLRVCIADLGTDRLTQAAADIARHSQTDDTDVLALEADISRDADLVRLREAVIQRFGRIDVLMNNAAIQPGSSLLDPANWQQVIEVNLWGVIRGTQAFAPAMIKQGRPGLIINTGSKQGITAPPGDPAYNVSKAAVKVFSESLQHELRNIPDCTITSHLLIPGYVYTGLTARGRTEKPASAWTSEQTVDYMLERLEAGDFYILCPDNDVPRELDQRRILWAAGDITENRPPLSRWHGGYDQAFQAFVRGE